MVLVNAGYPHVNEFIRKVSAILARALKYFFRLCFMPKSCKNMGLKGHHIVSLRGATTCRGQALILIHHRENLTE
jgi:hypothetical protein